MSPGILSVLSDRLRWDSVAATVPGSLPVLFFGDLFNAKVASIGLNPSRQEYNSRNGVELSGSDRRFETLSSLGAPDRRSLSESQALQAIRTMTSYFEPNKPVYSWFRPLARVLDGFGTSFTSGGAAHLDLVQEATDPVWTGLRSSDRSVADNLLYRDLEFLRWQIETFPLHTLVCTSATIRQYVLPMVAGRVIAEGEMARLRWFVASGKTAARKVCVVGWNLPLLRPTGLTRDGHRSLGALLRQQVASVD